MIEVVIFTAIVGVFFVIAASVMTTSMVNMKVNEHKILASHYARQLEEWFRSERDNDWDIFITNAKNMNSKCFNNLTLDSSSWAGTYCGMTGLNPPIFQRQVTLATAAGCAAPPSNYCSEMDVEITVSWIEFGRTYSVKSVTLFSVLEQ